MIKGNIDIWSQYNIVSAIVYDTLYSVLIGIWYCVYMKMAAYLANVDQFIVALMVWLSAVLLLCGRVLVSRYIARTSKRVDFALPYALIAPIIYYNVCQALIIKGEHAYIYLENKLDGAFMTLMTTSYMVTYIVAMIYYRLDRHKGG